MNLRFLSALSALGIVLGWPGATGGLAETAPERVVVTAAPLGRFGFGTGFGGPIWRSTIGHLVVISVLPGGPAERAGIRKGDELLAVNGLTIPGRARSEVFAALRTKDARQVVAFRVTTTAKGGGPVREVRVRADEKP